MRIRTTDVVFESRGSFDLVGEVKGKGGTVDCEEVGGDGGSIRIL